MSISLQQIYLYLFFFAFTVLAQNTTTNGTSQLIQPQYNLNVYLAGPGVFLAPDLADSTARSYIATCQSLGLNPLHPLNEVILQEDGKLPAGVMDPNERAANDWYMSDLGKIEMSAGIIAEITAFRGPNMDPGTAFELGYATARGLKVVLWSQTANTTLAERTDAQQQLGDAHGITDLGTGQWASIDGKFTSLLCTRPVWTDAIPETPATENLMISRPETPVYTTFEAAAARMREVLINGADSSTF